MSGPSNGRPDGPIGDPGRSDPHPGSRRRGRDHAASSYAGPSQAGRRHERRRPWRPRHRDRPGWWPAGEPWPPQGEFPWRRMRRMFFIRFAIGIVLIFMLVIVGPLIVIGQVLTALGLAGASTGLLAVVVLLFLIVAAARAVSRFPSVI